MNVKWRIVGFGWAGYLFVWALAAYIVAIVLVAGLSVDLRQSVAATLMFAPFGTVFALLAESATRAHR